MSQPTTPTTPASPLERGYRRLLRVLPAGHRERWGDDMVAVLLESEQDAAARAVADEGPQRQAEEREIALLQRPPAREALAVLALAARLHLAAPTTPGATATGLRWGAALRLVALLGLLVPAAESLVALVGEPFVRYPADAVVTGRLASAVTSAVWVLVWALLVVGHRRAAAGGALLLVGSSLAWRWADLRHPELLADALLSSAALVVPVVALLAWHRDAPPLRRAWLWALPGAAAASYATGLVVWLVLLRLPDDVVQRWWPPSTLTLVALGTAVLALRCRSGPTAASRALAALVLALTAAVGQLPFAIGWVGGGGEVMRPGAALALLAAVLAAVALRRASHSAISPLLAAREAPEAPKAC